MEEMGFIRLSRKIFRSDLWNETRELSRFEAWLDIISMAAFDDHRRIVQDRFLSLSKGELVASVRYLAARWRWHRNRVQRFLQLLEKQERIETRTESGITIISLTKYEYYNARRDTIERTNGSAAGHGRDSRGTAAGQIKEGEEREEVESEYSSAVPAVVSCASATGVESSTQSARKLPPSAADPRHRAITKEIKSRFRAVSGREMPFSPRGVASLKRFLDGWVGSIEEFWTTAEAAWKRSGDPLASGCKRSCDLHGLCDNWALIEAELSQMMPVDGRQKPSTTHQLQHVHDTL